MKTPVLEVFLNKIAGLQTCNFIKKRLEHRCFPVNIAKFLRTLSSIVTEGTSNKISYFLSVY